MLFQYTHDRPAKRRRLLEHVRTLRTSVGIVFSRVVRSSEIQVEEYRLSLFRPPLTSPSAAPLSSTFRFLQDSGAAGWRAQIGFRVFRQTSGPLPSEETEDKENRSTPGWLARWRAGKAGKNEE